MKGSNYYQITYLNHVNVILLTEVYLITNCKIYKNKYFKNDISESCGGGVPGENLGSLRFAEVLVFFINTRISRSHSHDDILSHQQI